MDTFTSTWLGADLDLDAVAWEARQRDATVALLASDRSDFRLPFIILKPRSGQDGVVKKEVGASKEEDGPEK